MRSLLSKKIDLFWAIAAVGLFAIGALVVSLFAFAARADADARQREASIISKGVADRIDAIAGSVPNVIWDEAVRNLDNRFNRAWAHRNIGQFFHAAEGFEFAYILNAQERPIYAMQFGEAVPTASYAQLRDAAAHQIAQVREAESARRAQARLQPLETLSNRIQSSAVRDYQGRLFVVTATLVQPDFGTRRIRHERAPIVVSGRELDVSFTTAVGAQFLLDNVRLERTQVNIGPRDAYVPIRDESGLTLAYYAWTPRQPGSTLLDAMLPALALLLAALSGVALHLFFRARRYARGQAESEARTHHLAFHDNLTGLANRVRVEQRLKHLAAQSASGGETFALHCIDLDRFKELNDTFGHAAGDELLKAVAGRLAGLCRGSDICARLGGDEFAIIQSPATQDGAVALAKRIVTTLDQPFGLSIGARHLGASVGVTIAEGVANDPLEWLRQSDLALYAAKTAGRNCWRFFDPEMDAALRERRLLREDLEHAIARGELTMVYQPQVNKSGETVGVEALARWTHLEKGPIPPTLFIPLAEETGLITALGEFAMRRVFEDSRKWPGLKIAVNLSATQLQAPNFLDRVSQLVDETGIDPEQFELELTESVLLDESGHTRAKLQALRRMGFSLALDDFGTGYSSLSYIQRFPISKIKIDRSFVTNLGVGQEADEVIGAIVKLARALQLSVIAEGVETTEQWLRLQAVGCVEIQGYVASRPISAADLSDRLKADLDETAPARAHLSGTA